jgi:hypothetical protein
LTETLEGFEIAPANLQTDITNSLQLSLYTEAQRFIEDLAPFSTHVAAVADVFHQRVLAFVEKTAAGNG